MKKNGKKYPKHLFFNSDLWAFTICWQKGQMQYKSELDVTNCSTTYYCICRPTARFVFQNEVVCSFWAGYDVVESTPCSHVAVLTSEAAVTKCCTTYHYIPLHQHLIPCSTPAQHGQTTSFYCLVGARAKKWKIFKHFGDVPLQKRMLTLPGVLSLFTTATLLFFTARVKSQYVVESARKC